MPTKLVSYVTDVEKMACLLMLKITGKQKMWEKKKKKESNTNLTDFQYQKTALSTVI